MPRRAREEEAHRVAELVRRIVPLGSAIDVRPLARLRRFLLKERFAGNYADAGDGGGGGGNGGG